VRLILASASPRRAELLRAAGFAFEVHAVDVDERVRDGEVAAIYVRRLAAEKSAAALAALKGCATETGKPAAVHAAAVVDAAAAVDAAAVAQPFRAANTEAANAAALDVAPVAQPFRAANTEAANAAAVDVAPVAQPLRAADTIILAADTAVVVDGAILGKPRDDADAAAMLRRLSGRWHEVMTCISLRAGALEVGRVETTRVEFASLSPADIAWYVASGEGCDKAGAYAIQGLGSRFVPRIKGSYANVVGLPISAVVELLPEFRAISPAIP
jgi:septum formation protein